MRQYLNDAQMEFLYTGCKDNVVVGGRGIGKGLMHAAWNLRNFQRMPGSITGFVAANTKRALTNTLPSMLIHWENWGLKRDLHWAIGRKPREEWGWAKPRFEPENWENIISFYNGSIGFIISQDRKGTSNSQSYDALDIDEAKYINFEQLKDETFPALRGNRQFYGSHYFHGGMFISSDMPVTKKGSWFLRYKEQSDYELIAVIQGLVHEIWRKNSRVRELKAQGEPVPYHLKREIDQLQTQLCQLRSKALFYREYSSIYNIAVLGEAWLSQMKRDLPPLTFQTSILCKPIGITRDGFYSNLTPQHKYSATNFSYLDSLDYKYDREKDECSLMDADVDTNAPLCVAFDYNANINWMVVGQPQRGELKVLKSFWVKYERKLPALIEDFCKYYRHHRNKRVNFYYDSTALGSNYAVNTQDFRWVIREELLRHGWSVNDVYIGKPMAHVEKYLLINRMLAGQATLKPMFNEQNNEDLLISIQTAGVYNGGKDKRGEKLAETEEDRLENRTDGSDAFDTLCIGCEKFPQTFEPVLIGSVIV